MKKFLLILLYLVSFCAVGQSVQKDLEEVTAKILALKKLPKSFKNDTLLVMLLVNKSSFEMNLSNSNSSIESAEEAYQLAQKIKWKKGILEAIYQKSTSYELKGQYFSAIDEGLKLLKLIDLKNNPEFYLHTNRAIGSCYMCMEKPIESKKHYEFVMKYMTHKNIGEYTYNHVFIEYGGLLVKYMNKPNEALPYLLKAKKGIELIKDSIGIGYVNSYLGIVYSKLKMNKLAEEAFDNGIKFYKLKNVNYLLPDALNHAAEHYNNVGNYEKAKALAKEGLEVASRIGILFNVRDSNRNLYKAYFADKNYEKALLHYKSFADSRDSMNQANIDDRLKVVRYDYDTQIQKAKITEIEGEKLRQQLKIKNQLNWLYLLLGGIFLASVFATFYYKNYQKEKKIAKQKEELLARKIKELEQEKQLTAVSSIMQGQEKERSRMAKDLHDGLGGILSGIKLNLSAMRGNQIIQEADATIFSRSISQLDTAIQEMRRVAHNLMPEALLKFGLNEAVQDFCDGINHAGAVHMKFNHYGPVLPKDQSIQVILYRIIQELSNNAIKYANAKTILIQLTKHEKGISLTVEDDGNGFDISELEMTKGAGIENVISRVNYLKGTFTIDSEIEKGTSCFIEIPE
jgi:two-component system, NarL family, sensor kinase